MAAAAGGLGSLNAASAIASLIPTAASVNGGGVAPPLANPITSAIGARKREHDEDARQPEACSKVHRGTSELRCVLTK